jgi:PAS domain S-box-containing protein
MDEPIRILMAEDLQIDAQLAEREIKKVIQSYSFQRVETREAFLLAIDEFDPDLIISDYHMPVFDGLTALKLAMEVAPLTPVIILTGAINEDTAVECMKAGAADYVIKEHVKRLGQAVLHALEQKEIRKQRHQAEIARRESEERYRKLAEAAQDAVYVMDADGNFLYINQYGADLLHTTSDEIVGKNLGDFFSRSVTVYQKKAVRFVIEKGVTGHDENPVTIAGKVYWINTVLVPIDENGKRAVMGITRDVTERKLAEEQLRTSNALLLQAYDNMIEALSGALDLRDKETENHTQRVVDSTMRLAEAVGIQEDELVHVRRGAYLHDLGKIGIPDRILHKEGPLTDEEWHVMRQHPQYAYDTLSSIEYLQPALDIPFCHHEKWDGTGYPRQLKGEDIPLAARLFAIVDVWDALTHQRPYRPQAWSKEVTLSYIQKQSGKHFDPRIVEIFQQVQPQFKED